MSELPQGWAVTTVAAVIEPYETIDPTRQPDRQFQYVDIGSIDNRLQKITDPKEFLGREAPSRARRVIKTDDILFSTVRTYLKNIALVTDDLDGELTTTGIVPLRPNKAIMPSYLFNWVRSDEFISSISKSQSGTLYPAVSDKHVLAAEVAVPPIAEQKRIVSQLENLVSHTAVARTALEYIPTLIEKYKSNTLRKAFNGELTAEWRNNKDTPQARTVALGEVALSFSYGSSAKSSREGRVPVLRMGNIQAGRLDWSDLVYTSDEDEIEKYRLSNGDVLFNRTNSPALVGKTAIYQGERPAIYAGYLIRIRCGTNLDPKYLTYCLNSPQGRDYCRLVKSDSVSQSNINSKKLSAFSFRLPELDEQKETIRRIEAAFAWIDRVSDEYNAVLKLLSALDASILHAAFNGKLVPQNPHDESASALLDRIKAENQAVTVKTRSGRKGVARARKPTKRGANMSDLIEVLKSKADWVSAGNAAQALGIGDGATSDAVEEFYNELRMHLQNGQIEVERRGSEDWLRLISISEE